MTNDDEEYRRWYERSKASNTDEEYRQWYENSKTSSADEEYRRWYEESNSSGEKQMLNLKLTKANYFDEPEREHEKELIQAVDDGKIHPVKLTTNLLDIKYDRRDQRQIVGLNGIKLIYKMESGGCLILIGNLGCSFRQPFGGEFYVKKAAVEPGSNFDAITGCVEEVTFSNYPMSIESMQFSLATIAKSKELVFNLSQFDEFMELFEFYKALSGELNNNTHYSIESTSRPYYFVPIDQKDIEVEEEYAVKNQNGIVIGYKLEDYKFETLSTELQDCVLQLIDIKIKASVQDIKIIRNFSDNLYLSDESEINEKNDRNLNSFELKNIEVEKDYLILSGEAKTVRSGFKYLHLYDMGQKVKLESIDNSLRLIHQGASGAAAELLEYIIGDKQMPSNYSARTRDDNKDKYIAHLDESQKQAFLMATDGSPVSLIKGPPGTGKTFVINAIVQYITKELKQKVVISSQTHVAIDNVLDEIMENYDPIIPNRITNRKNKYSGQEIDTTIYKTWAKKFDAHNKRAQNTELAEQIANDMVNFRGEKRFRFSESVALSDYSVIGATTTTSAIGGKKGLEIFEGYDWLIIDEVSKCPITEVLRYLPYVSKIIMVGDDYQLAPLLEFQKEEVENLTAYNEDKFEKLKKTYEESVFAKTLEKARKVGRLVTLNVNYRSVASVLNAYNIFYNGELIGMRERVRPQKVQFTERYQLFNEKDVFFVDVKNGKEAIEGTSRYNVEELRATREILSMLMENTMQPEKVSVSAIFPYGAQIDKFQRENRELINAARKKFKSFEIDTVDAFQGRETDIVLVNTVVTDVSRGNFLHDFRRINVSMSRARDKLFIFGNPTSLSKIEMKVASGSKRKYFADIIDDIKKYGHSIQFDGEIDYAVTSKPKIKII